MCDNVHKKVGTTVGWEVLLSEEAESWLNDCHRQAEMRAQIKTDFRRTFDLLETHGPTIGMPYVRKIRGKLWEARVSHSTGAYRAFFGFAPGKVIVVACGEVKKSDRFPPQVYDWAERKVEAFIAEIIRGQQEQSKGGGRS